ncbi:PREDICTED: aminopeptidase M1-like [Nelumbo nucifera]|uniref:Aminopeptidase M1-like n=1 Tax=Nelumbo nucifera TaxID=4432 RepID=A0A1U8Q0U8_NELNU|nr:PREDICTED: aminopeptidase M1-like [Nelumbo nucifera]
MAVTQFQPADARRCFPCWDEPATKAIFKISVDVPYELMALSNMPVIEENFNGHLKTVTFQESPIMSTYLVAVIVALFDYLEDHTSDGIKVRVYCQVGKENQGKFALDVAVRTLDIYKIYFGVPYPLPKLDMVAIPDFAVGARRIMVANTVAHELAHQWFGNLVTMLNEGFATWISYLATDTLFPEWKVEVNHVSEIEQIFDAISYTKGAAIIQMLQSYLGPDCFQRSMASYIRRYACLNTKTEDLWAVLEEPVNMLMNSWTKQKGYPVVSVTVKGHKLEFEQVLPTKEKKYCHTLDAQMKLPLTEMVQTLSPEPEGTKIRSWSVFNKRISSLVSQSLRGLLESKSQAKPDSSTENNSAMDIESKSTAEYGHTLGTPTDSLLVVTTVKLDGTNYLAWPQSVKIHICSRGKWGFISRSKKAPLEDDPTYEKWVQENYTKLNVARSYKLRSDVKNLRQGKKSLATYFSTLKSLWQEIDLIEAVTWDTPNGAETYGKLVERNRVFEFLTGLNPEYDITKQNILSKESVSLSQAYALVSSEEIKRQV